MLPKEYGSGSTCHRRFQEWTVSKVFQKLWVRLLRVYDDLKGIKWTWQSLDSISVKAPLGGILQVQILQTEANWEQSAMYLRIKKVFHNLLVSQVQTHMT
jgi:transposase